MEIEIRREYFFDGSLNFEKTYLNEVRHGIQKGYWISTKKIMSIWNMKNNMDHGMSQRWMQNGVRSEIYIWKMQARHGIYISFIYGKI